MGRRPGRCYRFIRGKPLQKSKYCRSVPEPKIKIFDIGKKTAELEEFPVCVALVSLERQQHSSESYESVRMMVNKYMTLQGLKDQFHLRFLKRPTLIVRINKMLTCAGADRLQTGMRQAYGKPYGIVTRVKVGQRLLAMRIKKTNLAHALEGLRRGMMKLSGKQKIVVTDEFGLTGLESAEFARMCSAKMLMRSAEDCTAVTVLRKRGPISQYAQNYVNNILPEIEKLCV